MLSLFLFSLNHLGIQTSDDAAMLSTAGAIWDDRTIAIPDMEWLNDRVDIGKYNDGLLYSKFGLGQSLVAAGLYGIGEAMFPKSDPFMWADYPIVKSSAGGNLALYTDVLLASLLIGLVVFETQTVFDSQVAVITGVLLMVASPLWLAARGFGSEIGSALGLTLAGMAARRAHQKENPVPLWLSVVGLGISILFRPSSLAFGFAWLVWLWRRPRREWVTVGMALALAAAIIPAFNWIRYGDLMDAGYVHGSGFALQVTGLAGYLIAPGRSLLVFAPWGLVIIPFVIRLARKEFNWETGVAAGVLGFYVVHSMWREWNGGWSFGPRLLIPVLPIIAVTAAPFFGKLMSWNILFFLPGSLLQVAAVAIDPSATHLQAIVKEGATFEEMVVLSDRTVWSIQGNIVALQLQAVATPENFFWLVLWGAMLLAWIGHILSLRKVQALAPG